MMNAKHKRFVQEYLIDLNATKAAERAGYSSKTARVQGPRLLLNAAIRAAVQAGMDKRAQKTEITAAYVLTGIQETIQKCQEAKHAQAALKGYELLGKHLKLFTDKVEVSGALAAMSDEDLTDRLNAALGNIGASA